MRVIIEGAKLVACDGCSNLGKPVSNVHPSPRLLHPARRMTIKKKPSYGNKAATQLQLVDDLSSKVREARMKMNMSQEKLAVLAKEKLSIIQKIEAGRFLPTDFLAKGLEHILRVKLLVENEKVELPAVRQQGSVDLKLGDVAKFRSKFEGAGR